MPDLHTFRFSSLIIKDVYFYLEVVGILPNASIDPLYICDTPSLLSNGNAVSSLLLVHIPLLFIIFFL